MLFTDTKFAYFHRPTKKWVKLVFHTVQDVDLYLEDEFSSDILYNARNVIEEDLLHSWYKNERYAVKNFLEFELKEIKIEYSLKYEDQTETK